MFFTRSLFLQSQEIACGTMTSLVKEAIRKKFKKECDKGKTENNTRRTRKNYLQNKD